MIQFAPNAQVCWIASLDPAWITDDAAFSGHNFALPRPWPLQNEQSKSSAPGGDGPFDGRRKKPRWMRPWLPPRSLQTTDGCRRSSSSGRFRLCRAAEDSESMRNRVRAPRPPPQTTGHSCDPRSDESSVEGIRAKQRGNRAPRSGTDLVLGLARLVALVPARHPQKVAMQLRTSVRLHFQSAFEDLSHAGEISLPPHLERYRLCAKPPGL